MIPGRPQTRKQNSSKQDASANVAPFQKSRGTDYHERHVGNHIPEIRNSPEIPAVCELMETLNLPNRRDRSKECGHQHSKPGKPAPIKQWTSGSHAIASCARQTVAIDPAIARTAFKSILPLPST